MMYRQTMHHSHHSHKCTGSSSRKSEKCYQEIPCPHREQTTNTRRPKGWSNNRCMQQNAVGAGSDVIRRNGKRWKEVQWEKQENMWGTEKREELNEDKTMNGLELWGCGLSKRSIEGVLLLRREVVKMAKHSTDSLTIRALYSSHAQPLFSAWRHFSI